jgi:hypothetical protein
MKLKRILFLGIAGGVVAAIRKRGAPEQVQQVVERAKDAAPEQVKQAVETVADKVTGDDADAGTERDETRRFSAPAEAGSQPPATPGGPPSDATQVRSTVPDTDDALATKAHDLPDDTVMPDTSDDDPSVQEAEAGAAADAAQIGGKADEPEVP